MCDDKLDAKNTGLISEGGTAASSRFYCMGLGNPALLPHASGLSTHLCHEHGKVAEFLAVLARLEFEEVQQRKVVPVLEEEFILVARWVSLDVSL